MRRSKYTIECRELEIIEDRYIAQLGEVIQICKVFYHPNLHKNLDVLHRDLKAVLAYDSGSPLSKEYHANFTYPYFNLLCASEIEKLNPVYCQRVQSEWTDNQRRTASHRCLLLGLTSLHGMLMPKGTVTINSTDQMRMMSLNTMQYELACLIDKAMSLVDLPMLYQSVSILLSFAYHPQITGRYLKSHFTQVFKLVPKHTSKLQRYGRQKGSSPSPFELCNAGWATPEAWHTVRCMFQLEKLEKEMQLLEFILYAVETLPGRDQVIGISHREYYNVQQVLTNRGQPSPTFTNSKGEESKEPVPESEDSELFVDYLNVPIPEGPQPTVKVDRNIDIEAKGTEDNIAEYIHIVSHTATTQVPLTSEKYNRKAKSIVIDHKRLREMYTSQDTRYQPSESSDTVLRISHQETVEEGTAHPKTKRRRQKVDPPIPSGPSDALPSLTAISLKSREAVDQTQEGTEGTVDAADQTQWRTVDTGNTQGSMVDLTLDAEETVDLTEDTADPTEDTADPTEDTADMTEDTADTTEDTADPTEDTANLTEEMADPFTMSNFKFDCAEVATTIYSILYPKYMNRNIESAISTLHQYCSMRDEPRAYLWTSLVLSKILLRRCVEVCPLLHIVVKEILIGLQTADYLPPTETWIYICTWDNLYKAMTLNPGVLLDHVPLVVRGLVALPNGVTISRYIGITQVLKFQQLFSIGDLTDMDDLNYLISADIHINKVTGVLFRYLDFLRCNIKPKELSTKNLAVRIMRYLLEYRELHVKDYVIVNMKSSADLNRSILHHLIDIGLDADVTVGLLNVMSVYILDTTDDFNRSVDMMREAKMIQLSKSTVIGGY